ncbi:MAG: hypothetical protein FD143_2682 [Ignavibacteria bacterium]|nr:MAG: hypothetical protein FD143_2682 [Ignavibacteria bacterium]KAF0156810.1 MAG: hypothetical protein FD188_2874 [Ignavibacteria bacterium]
MLSYRGGKMKHRILYMLVRPMFFWLFLLFILEFTKTTAQINSYDELPSGMAKYPFSNSQDSSLQNAIVKKNYWLPAVEVIGLNIGVWAYSKYLTSEGWSDINWETVKNNFKTGFKWDVDGYLMNQFWHPYHGSNYYNLARSNGLGFWESAPYAFGGSLIWEFVMENEAPSYNDIVNTPVTGIILGEISFRVSNLIIDESAIGFERFLREFSSTLIDPMQGFNRLIRGDMWKAGKPNKRSKFNVIVSSGVHNVFFSSKINSSKSYLALRADLNYGDQFSVSDHQKPFDYFTLRAEVNIAPGDNIVGIFASGVIWDNKLKLFENSKNIIGIYKEVDIHINTVYKLSATSVTGQIINTVPLSASVSMQNYFGLSAILMGATNSQYASESGKDYNIGPGASAKIGAKVIFRNFGEIYSNYKRFWIHTLSGAEGEEFVGLLNIGINYQLLENSFLGVDFLLYERYGDYKYFTNTQDVNSALRIYLKQNI